MNALHLVSQILDIHFDDAMAAVLYFLYSVISGLNILTRGMSPVCASVCVSVCLSVCPDEYFPQFSSDFDENALK